MASRYKKVDISLSKSNPDYINFFNNIKDSGSWVYKTSMSSFKHRTGTIKSLHTEHLVEVNGHKLRADAILKAKKPGRCLIASELNDGSHLGVFGSETSLRCNTRINNYFLKIDKLSKDGYSTIEIYDCTFIHKQFLKGKAFKTALSRVDKVKQQLAQGDHPVIRDACYKASKDKCKIVITFIAKECQHVPIKDFVNIPDSKLNARIVADIESGIICYI